MSDVGSGVLLRRARDADVAEIRLLVNAAYQRLGDMGLNFTGVYQDEAMTRERMANGEVYLLELAGKLVGTVRLARKSPPEEPPHLYVNQLAVDPAHQRRGLGGQLMDLAEERAKELGVDRVRLDTAIPAAHLLRWYGARGYVKIGEAQWRGKTYRSVILEKKLG